MRYLLGPAGRRELRRFVRTQPLLAFDYDGTLAPIVLEPAQADMRPATRHLLADVAARYACVVVSGRARRDLLSRMRGVGLAETIGNHGIEPWNVSPRITRIVRTWHRQLEARLDGHDGVIVENKTYSISIHYRRARDHSRARAAVAGAVSALDGARLLAGKRSVAIVPDFAPNKGTAVEQACARFRRPTALFIGDDATDEDVFALRRPGRLLTIRVRERRDSDAGFFIRSQAEIDTLLACLLRDAPDGR